MTYLDNTLECNFPQYLVSVHLKCHEWSITLLITFWLSLWLFSTSPHVIDIFSILSKLQEAVECWCNRMSHKISQIHWIKCSCFLQEKEYHWQPYTQGFYHRTSTYILAIFFIKIFWGGVWKWLQEILGWKKRTKCMQSAQKLYFWSFICWNHHIWSKSIAFVICIWGKAGGCIFEGANALMHTMMSPHAH